MARIVVYGGTGYAGGHIAASAARRGHAVTSCSRGPSQSPADGVEYRYGDARDRKFLAEGIRSADVAVAALSPRGSLATPGALRALYACIADLASGLGVRLGVVGGAGSLLVAEGGPMLAETATFPEALKPEAAEMAGILADLRARSDSLDWFFLSPPPQFGRSASIPVAGAYRVGGDVLLTDDDGRSAISGEDFADAFVTEIDQPVHACSRFTVAY